MRVNRSDPLRAFYECTCHGGCEVLLQQRTRPRHEGMQFVKRGRCDSLIAIAHCANVGGQCPQMTHHSVLISSMPKQTEALSLPKQIGQGDGAGLVGYALQLFRQARRRSKVRPRRQQRDIHSFRWC